MDLFRFLLVVSVTWLFFFNDSPFLLLEDEGGGALRLDFDFAFGLDFCFTGDDDSSSLSSPRFFTLITRFGLGDDGEDTSTFAVSIALSCGFVHCRWMQVP